MIYKPRCRCMFSSVVLIIIDLFCLVSSVLVVITVLKEKLDMPFTTNLFKGRYSQFSIFQVSYRYTFIQISNPIDQVFLLSRSFP